jgi:hypothetical protein
VVVFLPAAPIDGCNDSVAAGRKHVNPSEHSTIALSAGAERVG